MYDADSNGWIDLAEMTRIVKSIYSMMGPKQVHFQCACFCLFSRYLGDKSWVKYLKCLYSSFVPFNAFVVTQDCSFRPRQIYMEYLGAEKMRDKLIFQYEVFG